MKAAVLLPIGACAAMALASWTAVAATPVAQPSHSRSQFDEHYLMADEYVILDKAYKPGASWEPAYIAKLVTPASKATKNEAEFFIIGGTKKGTKVWTRHYFMTRIASREDLKLGQVAVTLDGDKGEDEIYHGPHNRDSILSNDFFIGTVNDVSELYKHYLQLAGYKVAPEALRVIVRP